MKYYEIIQYLLGGVSNKMSGNQNDVIKVESTRPVPEIELNEITHFPREPQKPKSQKICPKCNQLIEETSFEQHLNECIIPSY